MRDTSAMSVRTVQCSGSDAELGCGSQSAKVGGQHSIVGSLILCTCYNASLIVLSAGTHQDGARDVDFRADGEFL